ncbi:MAG: hypothetical protein AAF065_15090 [Verrucomicrobiota bacterium]
MAVFSKGVSSIVGFFLIGFCVGCSNYDKKFNVDEVSGMSFGNLSFPEGPFDYYMKDSLRSRTYVIYLGDQSFFELNESKVAVTLNNIEIEPGTSWDMMIHFEESSYSLPFDYSLAYDYIQLHTGDALVEADGLVNEEHGVYMLRVVNFKSED